MYVVIVYEVIDEFDYIDMVEDEVDDDTVNDIDYVDDEIEVLQDEYLHLILLTELIELDEGDEVHHIVSNILNVDAVDEVVE